MTNEPIEFLSINKTNKSLISNNNPQSIIKLKQNHRHFDKVSLIKYNHNKSLLEIIFIGFCSCFSFCNTKINRDIKITNYLMKHFYNYTDFYKFFDNFNELTLF